MQYFCALKYEISVEYVSYVLVFAYTHCDLTESFPLSAGVRVCETFTEINSRSEKPQQETNFTR